MPYIKKDRRDEITAEGVCRDDPVGEFNFVVTQTMQLFLGPNPNYERFNAAIGVLECAKLELYRRAVAPYEDVKIKENGDVY